MAPVFDRLSVLADPIRSRMLLALEQHELTVSELCDVLQLPQSTVSRHLKTLADQGWVESWRHATSRLYRLDSGGLDEEARQLWLVVREQVSGLPAARQDDRRLREVLARRQTRSQAFFASAAGQWDRLRDELFGPGATLRILPGLLDDTWVVGDLGCGTGQISEAIAPFVRRVVAVDASREMLQAARARLRGLGNVELRRGDLAALPIEDGALDAALVVLVLHHIAEPGRVLADVVRVLKPGGRLVVADMLPHDHEEYRQTMGHVWMGFGEAQMERLLGAAGFEGIRISPLPPDPAARGPSLFVASARRGAAVPKITGRPDEAVAAAS